MALRQTLQLSGGWKRRPQHTVCCGEYMTITALWTARRSRGPRCPFCSGPSAAPAGLGWASVLLLLELRNTSKIRAGGMQPEASLPFPTLQLLLQKALHTATCCLTTNRQQDAEAAGRALPLSCPPPDRIASQEGRAGGQVPFAHRMVLCSTCCMADTVFSQATCTEDRDTALAYLGEHRCPGHPTSTSYSSHQKLLHCHSH